MKYWYIVVSSYKCNIYFLEYINAKLIHNNTTAYIMNVTWNVTPMYIVVKLLCGNKTSQTTLIMYIDICKCVIESLSSMQIKID